MDKILIATANQGHKSLANAIEGDLKNYYQTKQTPDDLFLKYTKAYTDMYQFIPAVAGIPFKILESEPFVGIVKHKLEKHIYPLIEKELNTFQPKLVISTYYGFNSALSKLCKENHISYINIVHDPRTPFKADFDSASVNCVFDGKTVEYAKSILPEVRCEVTGWFTGLDYFAKHNLAPYYHKFHFDPDVFTLLVCGGSEGMISILKILPGLITPRKNIQVVFACGNNKVLYALLKQFKESLSKVQKLSKYKTHVVVIPFSSEMAQLMQLSDVVVGKAGPNLMFEAVASQKPFIAISHLQGQEEGNIDVIREYGIGVVEENPYKVSKLIVSIVRNPHKLDEYSESIQKLRQYNWMAFAKLRQLISYTLSQNSV